MSTKSTMRRALRLSRPDSERFFTVMLVFSHRTFRWSLARKTLLWTLGAILGVWTIAMVGSGYGFWATRKLMNFSVLQRETQAQQRQIRESLGQAETLEGEVLTLRRQVSDLLHLLNPKAADPSLAPGTSAPVPGPQSASESERLDRLKGDLERTEAQARLLRARMEPILQRWNHTPSIMPTAGYLSSGYGIRISPFSRANEQGDGLLGFHAGYDLTNAEGTPIQATADGTVESAGWTEGYGLTVVLRHGAGLQTLYAHMSKLRVISGQHISRGDIVGNMGRSGNATGVHLHYEVRRNGQPVNPGPYLRLQREWLSGLR